MHERVTATIKHHRACRLDSIEVPVSLTFREFMVTVIVNYSQQLEYLARSC